CCSLSLDLPYHSPVRLMLFLMHPRSPCSTLFPYTTLFRSSSAPARPRYRAPVPTAPASAPTHPATASPSRSVRQQSPLPRQRCRDRKSTRLNSSHVKISYAVFCLKKKNQRYKNNYITTNSR